MPISNGKETRAIYDMPGGPVTCHVIGEPPGGRWARVLDRERSLGFASDSLSSFGIYEGVFYATAARATRYAADAPIEQLAELLCEPPIVQPVLARGGELGRTGTLGALEPLNVKLLALKPAEDGRGVIVRVRNHSRDNSPAINGGASKPVNRLRYVAP